MSVRHVEHRGIARLSIIEPSVLSQHALATARSFLTGRELKRCDNLASDRARRNFTVGHALVRVVVAEQFGIPPVQVLLVQTCPTCGGPHGRPHIVGLPVWVSIAHTADVVTVAATRCGPIAVDCEDCPPRPHHRDAMARLLPKGEKGDDDREAVKRWTTHECLVKLGRRELGDQQPVRRSAHPQQPDTVLVEGSFFRDVVLPATVITVASLGLVDLSISQAVPESLQ